MLGGARHREEAFLAAESWPAWHVAQASPGALVTKGEPSMTVGTCHPPVLVCMRLFCWVVVVEERSTRGKVETAASASLAAEANLDVAAILAPFTLAAAMRTPGRNK